MRLGDLDELIRKGTSTFDESIPIADFIDLVDSLPTIDADPVRHGRWIWKGEDGDSRYMCSVCCSKEYVPTCNGEPTIWNYCPNCGARMGEVTE